MYLQDSFSHDSGFASAKNLKSAPTRRLTIAFLMFWWWSMVASSSMTRRTNLACAPCSLPESSESFTATPMMPAFSPIDSADSSLSSFRMAKPVLETLPGNRRPLSLCFRSMKYLSTASHDRDFREILSVEPRRIAVSKGSVAQSRSMRSP